MAEDRPSGWQRAERMLLVEELRGDGCWWLVLRSPVFVRAGERYRTEPGGLGIEHADGRRTAHPGGWETRLML
ncbi:MAG: hypothetical protein LH603_22670 [Pseudonocardia sp.]|nr:hypothetical protein [Pseudonocardia sp.]